MAIYGTSLLAICLLIGLMLGQLLGMLVGVEKNIGGVGIAMLLLILFCDRLQRSGQMKKPTQQGILFWSAIYIPIVVAMAASQNVVKAINGGALAACAGVLIVIVSFALVPLVSRIGVSDEWNISDSNDQDREP